MIFPAKNFWRTTFIETGFEERFPGACIPYPARGCFLSETPPYGVFSTDFSVERAGSVIGHVGDAGVIGLFDERICEVECHACCSHSDTAFGASVATDPLHQLSAISRGGEEASVGDRVVRA